MQNKPRFEWSRFWENSWPIDWNNFKKFDTLIKSVQNSNYLLKSILAVNLVFVIISFIVFNFALYDVSTMAVADEGGEFYEGLLGTRVNNFNPVLSLNSSEKKVADLIFHPLYEVDYSEGFDKPKINPILLSKLPEWQADATNPANLYSSLNFELKDGLKWSDGSSITNEDILYSFQRIQEPGGNPEFQANFKGYSLDIDRTNLLNFSIRPKTAETVVNPQLLYLANFQPISRLFFSDVNGGGLSNERLKNDLRSLKISTTSGYFKIPERVDALDNPVWSNSGYYNQVTLIKNNYTNGVKLPYLNKYIFEIYDNLKDPGGDNVRSLQRASSSNKLDLYTRFLSPEMEISENVVESLKLNQKIYPTNTYFNLYLNIQPSSGSFLGYFINQTLRKYTICQFKNFTPSPNISKNSDVVSVDKRFLPVGFTDVFSPECDNIETELTTATNDKKQTIYSIESDERSGMKRVKVFGLPFDVSQQNKLRLLALTEFKDYAIEIQNIMLSAGMPTEVSFVGVDELETTMQNKNYHLLLLPTTIYSTNPYPIFGLNGQNVSNISINERVNGRDIEEQLAIYSNSNLQNLEAKQKITDFFKTQYLMVNLFQAKREINYSNKVNNITKDFKNTTILESDTYKNVNNWYINTKRKFKFL
jgi:Bacterial extracellular solute-binding proteins, family 5 Middle